LGSCHNVKGGVALLQDEAAQITLDATMCKCTWPVFQFTWKWSKKHGNEWPV